MFKKLSLGLTLACGALLTPFSHAAIVSLDYSGTLSNSNAFQGTISWDASTTGTYLNGGTAYEYSLKSYSLIVGGTDYSQYLTNARVQLSQTLTNQDAIYFWADVSNTATGILAGSYNVTLGIVDTTGSMFSSIDSLPVDLNFLQSLSKEFGIAYDRDYLGGTATVTATPPAADPPLSNDIPEPGTLPLLALAGLALMATRRRPMQRAASLANAV